MRYFLRFTYPSVLGQSDQDFTWIILVDSKTPRRFTEQLQPADNITFLPTDSKAFNQDELAYQLFQYIKTCALLKSSPLVATTVLDSDDAIHRDFIRTIKYGYEQLQVPHLIRFVRGFLFIDQYKTLLDLDYSFHVPTLIESSDHFKTALQYPASQIPHIGLTERTERYWLQVIHEMNVANNLTSTPSRKIGKNQPLNLLNGYTIKLNGQSQA